MLVRFLRLIILDYSFIQRFQKLSIGYFEKFKYIVFCVTYNKNFVQTLHLNSTSNFHMLCKHTFFLLNEHRFGFFFTEEGAKQ